MIRFFTITFIFALAICVSGLIIVGGGGHGRVALAAPLLTTWYVDAATGHDANDCLTPTSACLTVGEAVSRAAHGDAIQIAAGVYEENLNTSLVLTLIGAGTNNTFLDGADTHRVLSAAGTGITLVDLTIQRGRVTNENGGAVVNYGRLTLENVRVISSTAVNGGGAAIFNSGDLILQGSEISGNHADGAGGGLYTWANSTLTATNSLIANNEGSFGGGLYNLGTAVITSTTFQGNFAPISGGGLVMFGGAVSLASVTLSGNLSDGYGAGLVNNTGTLTLTNSTISGNIAPNYAGLANISQMAQTTIRHSTIAHNVVTGSGLRWGGVANLNDAVISWHNSIVAHNHGRNCLTQGNWTSLGHNLANDEHCNFTAAGDLQNTPASLAPLADYGGPTATHALLPGSAALDSGDNTACLAADQRGIARPVDGDGDGTAVCDRGAFEARHQLVVSDVLVLEGDTGTTTAVFTVTLTLTNSQPVTVTYETVDGTAVAGIDYTAASGTLTFGPGETSQTIPVLVSGDTDDEPDETFSLHLSHPTNADILDGQATATIIDDDGLPSLTLADVTVLEGNSGTAVATFTVVLSPAAADTVTVEFATTDGTAVAGADYTTASGTLTFDPGETSQLVAVTIHGDQIDEGDGEAFVLQLSNALNANLVDAEAIGVITDDDIARVSLANSPLVAEGDLGTVTAVFTVSLDVPTAFPVTVDFYTSSGVGGNFATPGIDFAPISGTLSLSPGETEKTISVLIYGDLEEEADEVFSLYLINANPISIYASAASATILNDDGINRSIYLPLVIRP